MILAPFGLFAKYSAVSSESSSDISLDSTNLSKVEDNTNSMGFINPRNSGNALTFGFDRIAYTYLFNITGSGNYNGKFGSLSINQNYRGTSIRSGQASYREDEVFNLTYEYPFFDNIVPLFRQNWIISSDTRSIGLNNLERLNASAGGRYLLSESAFFEATAGIESNKQLGIRSDGFILDFAGKAQNIELLDFDFSSNLGGEYLSLNFERRNLDIDWSNQLLKYYDDLNQISILLSYKATNRDFFSPSQQSYIGTIPVESRDESRWGAGLNINFVIGAGFSSKAQLSFSSMSIERSFKTEIESLTTSKINRNLSELQLNLSGVINYDNKIVKASAGLNYSTRNEQNRVSPKFTITSDELKSQQELERQRDNIAERTRLFAGAEWQPSRIDTIKMEYSVSLLRYDTPSLLNNDDRDEFNTYLTSILVHRFSDITVAALAVDFQLNHLVFLKAARSSMNYWNHMLKLSPAIRLAYNKFGMSPQLEVLANYSVYDYESASSGVRSFSFRQIAYKDSLWLAFHKDYKLTARVILQYSERGLLNWQAFSESPQNGNFENYFKVMVLRKFDIFSSFGAGIRYYGLFQKTLGNSAGSSNAGFNQTSIGPEVLVNFNNGINLNIMLQGWFEFQFVNGVRNRTVPNLYLQTNYRF
jgi:hypothetical protein